MKVQEFIQGQLALLENEDDEIWKRPAKWFCSNLIDALDEDEKWATTNGWAESDAVKNIPTNCVVGSGCIKLFLLQLQVIALMDSMDQSEVITVVDVITQQMKVWMYG